MNLRLLFSLLLFLGGISSVSGKVEIPPIEIVCAGTGVEGTYIVRVSVIVKQRNALQEVLKKWGVYGIIFNGVTAGGRGCLAQPALQKDKGSWQEKNDFWTAFFSEEKGRYRKFATLVGEEFQVVRLPSKRYKITAVLSIAKDRLWNYLKEEGLVREVFAVERGPMMKPTVMVVPSNVWCKENGFLRVEDGYSFPDYKAALNFSMDLQNVISKINILLSERGFPLENLESVMKSLEYSEVEDVMIRDAETGARMQETSLDRLYRQSKSDIVLQLTWGVNETAAKRSVTFNLQALDSYTNKQVAGVQGTGAPSFSAEVPVLLEESILSHMDILASRLTDYFEDMCRNGREITLDVRLFDTDIDFETEYNDEQLAEVIARWIAEATVNRSFNRAPSTATMLQFRNVRIPLVDKNGQPMDAYSFARGLAKYLKKPPYLLEVKVVPRGLGRATVVIRPVQIISSVSLIFPKYLRDTVISISWNGGCRMQRSDLFSMFNR